MDYTIASRMQLLEGTRARIDEVATRVRQIQKLNKKRKKFMIAYNEAGRNSLTTPVQSGK